MTIIVTGAQGFIATALIAALNAGSDPDSTSITSFSRQDFDLPDPELVERGRGAKTLIHIAGRSYNTADPKGAEPLYQNENVLLTRRLLHVARHADINHFIYLSSIGVNGNRTAGTAFTEDDPANPQTPYAQSKLDAEQKIIQYCTEHNIKWTIIRSPMVYGPDARGNIQMLQKLIRTGLPLPFGMIRNKRSFISIDNLCDLIAHCIHAKNAQNQLYLACDGVDHSTRELVRILAKHEKRRIIFLPIPVWLLKSFASLTGLRTRLAPLWLDLQINPHKIFTQLGWRPKDVQ